MGSVAKEETMAAFRVDEEEEASGMIVEADFTATMEVDSVVTAEEELKVVVAHSKWSNTMGK